MTYKTVEAILHPDGKLSLPAAELPAHPVRVMLTILEDDEDGQLAAPGDYLEQLTSYEERLVGGEIKWQ